MDKWQTQNKSVGCIMHLPSLIHNLWKLMTNLSLTTKLGIPKSAFKN